MGGPGAPAAWQEWARRVEGWGYSTLTVNDHLGPFGREDGLVAPMLALTLAATVTSSLRLASLVMNFDLRHAAVAASEWAALDVLSSGRAEPGFGAGWAVDEYRATGIRFDPPGVRLERFDEYVRSLKGMWTCELFSFDGKHQHFERFKSRPRPLQKPHPALLIGVAQPRMIRLAAREANIVSFGIFGSAEEADKKVHILREAAGPRFHELELRNGAQLTLTDEPPLEVAERALRRLPVGPLSNLAPPSPAAYLAAPGTFIGSLERIEERMYEVRERWGISYFTIIERNAEATAPLVRRLTGK
jgi:probable F420-dependent oxidoreductase